MTSISVSNTKLCDSMPRMKLNMDEAMDLMRYAGITFAPNSITDLAVQWFLSKKMYDVIELNIFLANRGEEPLN